MRDKYQEEQNIETLRLLETVLRSIFNHNNTVIISDNYYQDTENLLYTLFVKAKELGLLEDICQDNNISYEFNDYKYNKNTHKFEDSKFVLTKKKKN